MKSILNEKIIISFLMAMSVLLSCKGQEKHVVQIDKREVGEILSVLSSDDMRGRNALVPADIDRAADYIAGKFKQEGLNFWFGENSFYQVFHKKYKGEDREFKNVIGVLPGKSRPEEIVVFSAHYDHIGIIDPVGQDSIANGADDNASGVTGLIQLAKYYAARNDNARTLVFVAFSAEEIGLFGSEYFSEHVAVDKVVAMLNLEMIGKQSKFGKNSFYLTGFRYSNLGKILQQYLEGSPYSAHPDPYPAQQLFYRSDNRSLAKKGVPAHTISTVEIDKDATYHTVHDEAGALDAEHIAEITKAIIIGSQGIVSGKETPTRIKKNRR